MGRTQLNIRMGGDEKEEWREYADQSRWNDSITDFVKEAVREKIERMDGGDSTADGSDFDIPDIDPSGADNGEVLERIQDLQNDLQDLQGDVSDAVDAAHAQTGIDPDVSPDIYGALPQGEGEAVTAQTLADATDHGVAETRFALENMRRNLGDVKKVVEREHPESGEVVDVVGDDNVAGYQTDADPRFFKGE